MLNIVLTYIIAAQSSPAPVAYDTHPPPGLYSIYKNFCGEPLYMRVPSDAERATGSRMSVFEYDEIRQVATDMNVAPPVRFYIPRSSVWNNQPDAQPQQAAPTTKGPTFLQRLGRGMQATGQGMMYGGSAGSIQALPLQPVQPMQFAPMQRPIQMVPSGRVNGSPTYTFYP